MRFLFSAGIQKTFCSNLVSCLTTLGQTQDNSYREGSTFICWNKDVVIGHKEEIVDSKFMLVVKNYLLFHSMPVLIYCKPTLVFRSFDTTSNIKMGKSGNKVVIYNV